MAKLTVLDEDQSTQDFQQIAMFLAAEGINFGYFELRTTDYSLAKQETLSDEERILLLNSHPEIIQQHSKMDGYRHDVICLHPSFKYLDAVLQKFKNIHYHFENEHWYMIDGSAGFGFLGNHGIKFVVEITCGELLTVPEGKWQWVIPPVNNCMKSMRFFNTSGKIAQPSRIDFAYTQTG